MTFDSDWFTRAMPVKACNAFIVSRVFTRNSIFGCYWKPAGNLQILIRMKKIGPCGIQTVTDWDDQVYGVIRRVNGVVRSVSSGLCGQVCVVRSRWSGLCGWSAFVWLNCLKWSDALVLKVSSITKTHQNDWCRAAKYLKQPVPALIW